MPGASGAVNRWLGPDSVRHMSVTTATQRLTAAHHETQRDKTEKTREAGIPSSRAVSAGGGRCWVRTSVGLADGFTVSRSRPIGIAADLLFLHFPPRENRVLSAWRP